MSKSVKRCDGFFPVNTILAVAFLLIFFRGFGQTEPQHEERQVQQENITTTNPEESTSEYKIDGKVVSAEEYNEFVDELKEIEGTYHCAKTIGGGRNSYEATDQHGVIWICYNVVNVNNSSSRANKKSMK